jgi:hypothetical protein
MIGRRSAPAGLLAIVFFAAFFTLVASGRLGSADAGAQLQAATRLVTRGELGVDALPPTGAPGWQRAPNGRFYEPHDPGNILLMAPAAFVGHALSGRTADQDFASPPIESRAAVSLTYALVNALTCTFLFQLFALWVARRQAFAASLLFATTTMFLPYAKTAWDVMGACCGVSAMVYVAGRIVRGGDARTTFGMDAAGRPTVATAAHIGATADAEAMADVALLAAAFVAACFFRYTLAPFLGVSVAALAYAERRRLRPAHIAVFLAVSVAGLLPSFLFNAVRTGEWWRPGTAIPAYLETNNAIGGNAAAGLVGLIASPNRGLLWSSPMLILLACVPIVWKSAPRGQRVVFAAFAAGAAAYAATIASLVNWAGAVSWGPRYLVPVLPILFAGCAIVMQAFISRRARRAIAALAIVSALVNVVPATVNWSVAILTYPHALEQHARAPYQQAAVWHALRSGLAGREVELPPSLAADPVRRAGARFPDFWIARVMQRSSRGLFAGLVACLTLLAAALVSGRALLMNDERQALSRTAASAALSDRPRRGAGAR